MGRAGSRRRRDWPDGWTNGIRTERLILRALSKRDYNAWRSGHASRRPAQHRYDHGPVATDRLGRAQFNALAARHERLARRDRVYVLTAFTRGAGEHVGTFDLSIIRRKDTGWANVGYVIHNHHQRLGYGAEALRAVLDFGLASLGFHRIEAATRPDNAPAIACAKSAGMELECLRRSFWLDDDGWADHEIFVTISP